MIYSIVEVIVTYVFLV